ncbi:hypothetical protein LJC32_01195 [Oscillospiraceae bacterium OttesenSCG-928-F05]|nr:hypothetical protein [Oscillospiraceae bacterium OttesenSCG-928-F05]
MDVSAVPLTEMEDVKKILSFLEISSAIKEKQDFESLLSHMDAMETQFGSVFFELQNVRVQLKDIQDRRISARVSRLADDIGAKIIEAKEQFFAVKTMFINACATTFKNIRNTGISALNKTLEFLKIKPALAFLKGKIDKARDALQSGIARIEAAKGELGVAKSHFAKAGSIIIRGARETEAAAKSDKDITSTVTPSIPKSAANTNTANICLL